jgi:hypothetical protein
MAAIKKPTPRKVTEAEKALIKELCAAGCIYIVENQLHGVFNVAIRDNTEIPNALEDTQFTVDNELIS